MNTIKFKLDNTEYKIEVTNDNHTLLKFDEGGKDVIVKGVATVTKPTWKLVGYYPSVVMAVKAILNKPFKSIDTCSLKGYIDTSRSVLTELDNLIEEGILR